MDKLIFLTLTAHLWSVKCQKKLNKISIFRLTCLTYFKNYLYFLIHKQYLFLVYLQELDKSLKFINTLRE